jgi:nicotinate-nucleotide adenylyltransferase
MDRHAPDNTPGRIQVLASQGGRIGLLGGSFNPAHAAHVHVSLVAMRRLGLDAVWWLVSPQNPLKPQAGMAPLPQRLARARLVARHPRICVSAPEPALGTQYTLDTLEALGRQFPKARFVWLMGGDSMAGFHRWRRWPDILNTLPVAVIARPGFTMKALCSPAAVRFAAARVGSAKALFHAGAPAWIYLEERLDPTSATQIRQSGQWPTTA